MKTLFEGSIINKSMLTCDNPKYIETVSDMYRNLPSAATDNANPSNDCEQIKSIS